MSGLTDQQLVLLTRAAVLGVRQAHVLSDFERDLVRDVCRRFLAHRRAAPVSAAEWVVIDDAVAAMARQADRASDRRVLREARRRVFA